MRTIPHPMSGGTLAKMTLMHWCETVLFLMWVGMFFVWDNPVSCMPQIFAAYKKPGLRSRPGWFSLQSRITYKKITMANGKSGRPKAKDPKTHRYNFKLNDEQELHFRKMLEEAGYRENISKFILARLFG